METKAVHAAELKQGGHPQMAATRRLEKDTAGRANESSARRGPELKKSDRNMKENTVV